MASALFAADDDELASVGRTGKHAAGRGDANGCHRREHGPNRYRRRSFGYSQSASQCLPSFPISPHGTLQAKQRGRQPNGFNGSAAGGAAALTTDQSWDPTLRRTAGASNSSASVVLTTIVSTDRNEPWEQERE